MVDVDSEYLESTDVFLVESFPMTDDLSVPSDEIELTASLRGRDGELGVACRDVRRREGELRKRTVALEGVLKLSKPSLLASAFGEIPLPFRACVGVEELAMSALV